jgi:hypothetical protein
LAFGGSWTELLKINNYRAPRDKVICILNSSKVLFGTNFREMGLTRRIDTTESLGEQGLVGRYVSTTLNIIVITVESTAFVLEYTVYPTVSESGTVRWRRRVLSQQS